MNLRALVLVTGSETETRSPKRCSHGSLKTSRFVRLHTDVSQTPLTSGTFSTLERLATVVRGQTSSAVSRCRTVPLPWREGISMRSSVNSRFSFVDLTAMAFPP